MTTQSLASAENWAICNPHEHFVESAAKVEPGTERTSTEAQIDAFSDRAHWLEGESRCWHGNAVPVRKGEKPNRGKRVPSPISSGSALALLALAEGRKRCSGDKGDS